jgi:hypothetical protein
VIDHIMLYFSKRSAFQIKNALNLARRTEGHVKVAILVGAGALARPLGKGQADALTI